MLESIQKSAAIVGWFETPAELYAACESLRDAGVVHFDAHTPFPVHGLEKAMGLRPSRLPWIVLLCGLFGGTGGFAMQWWMSAVDYPQNISGKPAFSFQAFVPITFELTILFAAFGCFFGMWTMNRLPRFFDPVMQHPSFERATDDRFFVSIQARDARFSQARSLLEEAGAREVVEVAP